MVEFIKLIWQLPQIIIGWIYYTYLSDKGMILAIEEYKGIRVYTKQSKGCVSLGNVIFVSEYTSRDVIKHEYGHIKQSLMLGPLYLIIIGIPSILWAITHKHIAPNKSYYWFYTEHWANKLASIDLK